MMTKEIRPQETVVRFRDMKDRTMETEWSHLQGFETMKIADGLLIINAKSHPFAIFGQH